MPERDVNDLDRFWEDVVAGTPPDASGIDPTTAETVRRFHATDDVPGADPAFLNRLLEDLLQAQSVPTSIPIPTRSLLTANPNGRSAPWSWRPAFPARPNVGRRSRWALAQLATAALLLVTLGLGYIAFGPNRSDGPATTLPAAVGTPAPAATSVPEATAEETLLEVTLSAAELPPGSDVLTGVTSYTIAAGARGTHEPGCCPGPVLEYVVSGSYTVRVEGAIRVVRADGTVEEVPAGTEVVLGPGDGLLWRNEMGAELANTGDTPVELVSFGLLDNSADDVLIYLFDGWSVAEFSVWGHLTMPSFPVAVRLRRVELAGDGDLPVPAGAIQLVVPSSERPAGTPAPRDVATQIDGTFSNFGRGTEIVYVVTMEATGDAAGTPIAGTPVPF